MKKAFSFLLLLQLYFFATFGQKINKDGFSVTCNNITTNVIFIDDNVARVYKHPAASVKKVESRVVRISASYSGKIVVSNRGGNTSAASKSLKIIFNRSTNALEFHSLARGVLAAELPFSTSFVDADNDGASSYTISQGFRFDGKEGIYGFGQHQNGKFNQRHQSLLLRQRNMTIAIPFFQSSKGYGIYWDNYSLTNYKPDAKGGVLTSEIGDCIDYYFIAGTNADEVIKSYRNLTGNVPMLPLWSFGYIQSKERYRSQYELVDVVKKYRQLQIPLDAVIQDWQYWGADQLNWNAVDFLNKEFPDPIAAIDSIHQMNAKLMISVWPSFGSKTAIYKEFSDNDMLLDFPTYPVNDSIKVYDAFHPAAKKIYWNYMNKNLFAKGIDGWWLDATEPVQKEVLKNTNAAGTHELSFKDQLQSISNVKTFAGSFKSIGNLFPFETVRAVYNGQRNTFSDKRVFILTRSAFAGQQQTGNVLWSGDIEGNWDLLKKQIPAALNLSLSGTPYWNADIGGFYSREYPGGLKNVRYKELYLRWLQFATFTAMMRSHGTNSAREIYQLGKSGDIAFNVAEKYIRLRYQLQPYIYSASWSISSKGASLMRPLIIDYPADKKLLDHGVSYMFGESVLVQPVTDSIFSHEHKEIDSINAVAVETYLPKGEWFDFWTGKAISGGSTNWQNLTISQMPVYIKAGSIMPIAAVPQYSSIQNFKSLTIKIYPGKNATYLLYEDEGDNYNYEKKEYSLIKFQWNDKVRMLTIDAREGNFSGMLTDRDFKLVVVGTNSVREVQYNGNKVIVQF